MSGPEAGPGGSARDLWAPAVPGSSPSLIRLDDHLVSVPSLVGPQGGGMVGTEACKKKEGALHC